MSKTKLLIKEAILATMTGKTDSGFEFVDGKRNSQMFIEFEVNKVITCVVDEINHNVINIETREVFPLLEKDDQGRIQNDQLITLTNSNVVALRLMEKDWSKMSLLYRLSLESRSKKVYDEYLKGRQGKTLKK